MYVLLIIKTIFLIPEISAFKYNTYYFIDFGKKIQLKG